MSSNLFSVDPLQLYMGYDYSINDKIVIKQPIMRDVTDMGEQEYFSMVHTLTANPTSMKVQLDSIGIDWNEIEDFDLFMMLAPNMNKEQTSILLGDLDLSALRPYRNHENGDIVLANPESNIIIDKLIYQRIVDYIRKMHNIKAEVKHAKNKFTKKAMIEYDRQQMAANAAKEYKSYFVPVISTLQCKMGWTKDYILNMGIVEYFEIVARMQIINNADHLLSGVYAGTIDIKKINKKELNFMRELD